LPQQKSGGPGTDNGDLCSQAGAPRAYLTKTSREDIRILEYILG